MFIFFKKNIGIAYWISYMFLAVIKNISTANFLRFMKDMCKVKLKKSTTVFNTCKWNFKFKFCKINFYPTNTSYNLLKISIFLRKLHIAHKSLFFILPPYKSHIYWHFCFLKYLAYFKKTWFFLVQNTTHFNLWNIK